MSLVVQLTFMDRLLKSSGLGDETYLPGGSGWEQAEQTHAFCQQMQYHSPQ